MKAYKYIPTIGCIAIGGIFATPLASYGADKGAMAAFNVKESRAEHFVVYGSSMPGLAGRLWFRSCEKRDQGKQFNARAAYISRYYGPDIREGDEIIRIGDELVETMSGTAGHVMEVRARKKPFSIEVRSPNSKEIRKIVITGVPYAVITPDEIKPSPSAPKPPSP